MTLTDYYNKKILSFNYSLSSAQRTINLATKKLANTYVDHKKRHLENRIKRYERNVININSSKDKFIEDFEIMKSYGVEESFGNNNNFVWIAKNPIPENLKLSKGYFCTIWHATAKHYHANELDISTEYILANTNFLYGKKTSVSNYGHVYFDAKIVIKNKEWVDDSTDPLLFFNMNNKSVRDYLIFFSKVKDKFKGTSPYWIDNYLFLL